MTIVECSDDIVRSVLKISDKCTTTVCPVYLYLLDIAMLLDTLNNEALAALYSDSGNFQTRWSGTLEESVARALSRKVQTRPEKGMR